MDDINNDQIILCQIPTVMIMLFMLGVLFHFKTVVAGIIENDITITSFPKKAWVCNKKRRAFQCKSTAVEPIRVRFFYPTEVKNLYIKKLGYDTAKVKVTPQTQSINITLKKSSLLSLDETSKDKQYKKFFESLNDYIYVKQKTITRQSNVSFASPINLVEIDGKNYIRVTLNLGLNYQRKNLKSLYRERNKQKFYQKLSDTLLEDVAKDFLLSFADLNKMYKLDFNGLSLQIRYPKLKAKLYDDEHVETRVNISTWQDGSYQYTQTITWDEVVSELKVTNQTIYATYLALIPFSEVSSPNIEQRGLSFIQPLMVMSNDNRKQRLEKVP